MKDIISDKIKRVPISSISLPSNHSAPLDAAVTQVAESIVKFGLLYPLVVYESQGSFIVIDGYIRFLALQRLHISTVPIVKITGALCDDTVPLRIWNKFKMRFKE